jgi:hypothetical protein
MNLKFTVPIHSVVNNIRILNDIGLYVHDKDEEMAGSGVTISRYTNDIASVQKSILQSLVLVSSSTQMIRDREWIINNYIDSSSGQKFIDAFTEEGIYTYQVGGMTNDYVNKEIQTILKSFDFIRITK